MHGRGVRTRPWVVLFKQDTPFSFLRWLSLVHKHTLPLFTSLLPSSTASPQPTPWGRETLWLSRGAGRIPRPPSPHWKGILTKASLHLCCWKMFTSPSFLLSFSLKKISYFLSQSQVQSGGQAINVALSADEVFRLFHFWDICASFAAADICWRHARAHGSIHEVRVRVHHAGYASNFLSILFSFFDNIIQLFPSKYLHFPCGRVQ